MATIKEKLEKCFEMCDYIDSNMQVKVPGGKKLRESLKTDFLHFMIYISMMDDIFGDTEKAFIKDNLGFDISSETALMIKNTCGLNSYYGTKIPVAMKYFILANAGRKIKADRYDSKEAKLLAETYRELGQNYLAFNEQATEIEINAL